MSSIPTQPDFALLQRFAKHGDQAAFSELIGRHSSMVMGVSNRILQNQQDAQDSSQATFVQLARHAQRINSKQPLASWLYKVARNKALDQSKARARRAKLNQKQLTDAMQDNETSAHSPAIDYESKELSSVIDKVISQLPQAYRNVIILHYLEGKTHKQIADEFGCKPSAISMRLTRAKEKLNVLLSKRGITTGSLAGFALSSLQGATPALSEGFAQSTAEAASLAASHTSSLLGLRPLVDTIYRSPAISGVVTSALSISAASAIYFSEANDAADTEPTVIVERTTPVEAIASEIIEEADLFDMINTSAGVEDPKHAALYSYILENLGKLDHERNERGETLLQAAVRRGNCTGTFLLLYYGASPNVSDHKKETPLIQAMRAHRNGRGGELLRDMLVLKGADVNAHNAEGDTALIVAIEEKNTSHVEFLLWMGADIHPSSASFSRYPSAMAREKDLPRIAEMIKILEYPETAEYPEQNLPKVPKHISDALIRAAALADLARLEALLAEGAPIDTKNGAGKTPLYVAAQKLHVEVVTYLIFMGADVNTLENKGTTPLMGMMGWMLFEADWIRYMLLLAGAHTDTVAANGFTPLTLAAANANGTPLQMVIWSGVDPNEPSTHGTAMHIASKKGYQRIVEQLQQNGVTEAPFDSNDPSWQLHTATRSGDLKKLQQLIANGTDPDLADANGKNPMINAIHARRIDAARFFKEAKSNLNYQIPNSESTPLIAAVCWNYWEINNFRQELLEAGADPNITDQTGMSPLIRASKNGTYWSALSQLIYYGADINHRDKHGKSALDYALQSGNTGAADYLIEMGAEQK